MALCRISWSAIFLDVFLAAPAHVISIAHENVPPIFAGGLIARRHPD
jgi:hypothetical protein